MSNKAAEIKPPSPSIKKQTYDYLTNIGIKLPEKIIIYHNIEYSDLYEHETSPNQNKDEQGYTTNTNAVYVDTGIYTGRSPNDKYIVKHPDSQNNIWWKNDDPKSDNKAIDQTTWKHLKTISTKQLSNKK